MTSLRNLPSVEQLLQLSADLIASYGRLLTLHALRASLDDVRARFKLHPELALPSTEEILFGAKSAYPPGHSRLSSRSSMRRV